MQGHGIALGGEDVAVGVGDAQHAALIGIGAQILDAVGLEEEAVSAVGVEGHGGGAVVAGDGDALAGGSRGFFLLGLLFLGVGIQVADDLGAGEGPNGLGHKIEERGDVGAIVIAVGVAAVQIQRHELLHLLGIGVGVQFKKHVGGRRGGNGAVLVLDVAALGGGAVNQAQTAGIADLGALAGLEDIVVGDQGIGVGAVQGQADVDIGAGVVFQQRRHIGGQELVAGHGFDVPALLIEAHGEGAAESALAIAEDHAVAQRPGGFRDVVEQGGVLGAVVGAVGVASVEVNVHELLHLLGIGVGGKLKEHMSGGRSDRAAVFIHGIAALGGSAVDKAQAAGITDLRPLAGLKHIVVRDQRVFAFTIQLQGDVDIGAGVVFQQRGHIGGQELIIRHGIDVSIFLVKTDGIGSADQVSCAGGGGFGAARTGEHDGGDDGGKADRAGAYNEPHLFAGSRRGVAISGEGSDDVVNRCGQQARRTDE